MEDNEPDEFFSDFENDLAGKQEELGPDFEKVFHDNWWELLE